MSSTTGPDQCCTGWRKSRRSMNGGNCVEVSSRHLCIQVRDSAKPDDLAVAFTPHAWRAFIGMLKHEDPDAGSQP
jgi:hypothetical protein